MVGPIGTSGIDFLLFVLLCLFRCLPQFYIGLALPHRISQTHFRRAKQAHLEVAIGRHAQPVARRAKMLRHGRDEADAATMARHVPRLGRLVRLHGLPRQGGIALLNACEHVLVRHEFGVGPPIAVEWHVLDEANFQVVMLGQRDEVHLAEQEQQPSAEQHTT